MLVYWTGFGYIVVYKLYKQQRIPQEKFDPLFLFCFVGILVGARLGHCLLYEPAYFLSHPLEMVLPIHKLAEERGSLRAMRALHHMVERSDLW